MNGAAQEAALRTLRLAAQVFHSFALVAQNSIDNLALQARPFSGWKVLRLRAGVVMQAKERQGEPGLFEVVLQFEGNSWQFSTFAQGCRMQDALERAEKEFTVHSLHHRLDNMKAKATSAHVICACDDCSFAKRDGKWQLSQTHAG